MSDKYDIYHYEHGKLFYKRHDAGHWLHPSIKDFNRLCGIYEVDNTIYRMDSIENGYRLVGWKNGNPMSERPELIVTGGKDGIAENAIVFQKGNYEYIVPVYRNGHHNVNNQITQQALTR